LARIVALRARLAVLEGEIDEAMHWIQTGYAMARHVGEGPTVIQWLVGVAITGLMTEPLEDLIQRPEAPNLYWAIATRPQPFIELSQPLAGERSMLEQEVPLLRELDGLPWSPAQARVFANELHPCLSFHQAAYVPELLREKHFPLRTKFFQAARRLPNGPERLYLYPYGSRPASWKPACRERRGSKLSRVVQNSG